LLVASLVACGSDRGVGPGADETAAPKPTEAATPPAADPALQHDQDEYVDDVVAFMHGNKADVRTRMKKGSSPLKDEWNTWEKEAPMTPDRIKAFYKQTTNYIFELAEWHLWVPGKRESDLALFEDMHQKKPKNILDFGGGTGLLAIPLAKAGFDVTLADLDSTTLEFALFRAKRHDVKLKVWKSDVDAAPPDKKYDVIMCMDVLEHLPKDVLHDVVDKLVKLKHAKTEIVISAPFGRTAVHPMHLDLTDDTKQQVERLKTELPKD
jgi:2-polyprenyl-3-methyl-5-hydroxy-6-metoxy-1,4-benzoquinol methylase